ncbi:hypothetical protein [Mucilaginibacter gilvus]|uniref:DUF1440 domain-containing protein n=1 Tax=Mucilaginibacter gilvus TaxID=2305909 RepID=A0A3S3Z5X7_9SPHI|nr:hypothetical protein [Mucilaginibacter gilvus]RWY53937.1 hypothetical protein EPL05_07725 [Mucilaginibacter gilvus]
MSNQNIPGLLLTGIIATLIAGTLDALAAIYILAAGQAKMVFQYIAAGAIGREAAFLGGNRSILIGVVFHYLITAIFTLFFFILYQREALLRRNAGVVAFIYGTLMWVVMNFLVLPVSKLKLDINKFTFKGTITGIAILIICVALPIVLARYWYENKRKAA